MNRCAGADTARSVSAAAAHCQARRSGGSSRDGRRQPWAAGEGWALVGRAHPAAGGVELLGPHVGILSRTGGLGSRGRLAWAALSSSACATASPCLGESRQSFVSPAPHPPIGHIHPSAESETERRSVRAARRRACVCGLLHSARPRSWAGRWSRSRLAALLLIGSFFSATDVAEVPPGAAAP